MSELLKTIFGALNVDLFFIFLLRIQIQLVEDSHTGRFAHNVVLGKHVLIG